MRPASTGNCSSSASRSVKPQLGAAAGGTRTTIRFRSQIGFIRCPDLPEVPDSIAAVELYREPLVAFMRADHRLAAGGKSGTIAVSALASEPFVFFPRGLGTSLYDQVMTLCRRAGFSPRIEQEARANATILGLVAAGLGVSLLPESLQRVAAKGVACRALSAAGARSSIWLVHLRHDRSPAGRVFVALATANRAARRPVVLPRQRIERAALR